MVGYSLGGNLGLRLAGTAPPPALRAVCAISPTMDLGRCVDALERRPNAIYQWNFVRNLKRRMRRKANVLPGAFNLDALDRIRTVREFDDAFTAPHHGFRDAADYYHRASSLRVVDRIAAPTLVISAEDDPFVPPEQFRDPAAAANPNVTTAITRHGGHCGYYADPTPGFDGTGPNGRRSTSRAAISADAGSRTRAQPGARRSSRRFAKSGPAPRSSCLK